MHPSLKILLLILLAILVQQADLLRLFMGGGVLILAAAMAQCALFRRLLLRSKWLLLTMLLIYALTTPGEYIPGWESISLTYEGLHQGALQALRLTVMLAGLALLLGTTSRDSVMAGIHQLMAPWSFLGVHPDRFAARLWLTLHYVESAASGQQLHFWQRFEMAAGEQSMAVEQVQVERARFANRDWALLLGALILTAGSLA